MNRTPLGTSPKPRGRCTKLNDRTYWAVWSDIAGGYAPTLDKAWQAWRIAESLHQLQAVSPRAYRLPFIARWMD